MATCRVLLLVLGWQTFAHCDSLLVDGAGGVAWQRNIRSIDSPTEPSCTCPSSGPSNPQLQCQTPPNSLECDYFFEGSCYFFSTNRASRDESQSFCVDRSSHLVYIESEEEQQFITDTITTNEAIDNSEDWWIGLTREYTWLDETVSLPETEREICVYIRVMVVLGDDRTTEIRRSNDCGMDRGYVCEYLTPQEGCEIKGESCYRVVRDERMRQTDYAAARDICRGGDLASIGTSQEFGEIASLLDEGNYWIGPVRIHAWMDGSPALYMAFEGDVNRDCFRLRRSEDYMWEGRGNCDEDNRFICEWKAQPVASLTTPSAPTCVPTYIPNDLKCLSQSDFICVHISSYFGTNPPVLRDCSTNKSIEECGCKKSDGGKITCSCGSCCLVFDEPATTVAWSSNFTCTCVNGGDTYKVTAVDGETTCGLEVSTTQPPTTQPPTTQPPTTQPPTTQPSPTQPPTMARDRGVRTSSQPASPDSGNETAPTGFSAGEPDTMIGVYIAVAVSIFLVLVLTAVFILWRRNSGKPFWRKNTSATSASYRHDDHSIHVDAGNRTDDGENRPTKTTKDKVAIPNGTNTYEDKVKKSKDVERRTSAEDAYEEYTTIPPTDHAHLKPGQSSEDDVYSLQNEGNNGEGESDYTAISSDPYTAYNRDGADEYTDLQSTKRDGDGDYVNPEPVKPRPYRPANNTVSPGAQPKPATGDHVYLDLDLGSSDATSDPRIGLVTNPHLTTDHKYVDVDAPPIVFASGESASPARRPGVGKDGYATVDAPAVVFPDDYSLVNAVQEPDQDPIADHTGSGITASGDGPPNRSADTYDVLDRNAIPAKYLQSNSGDAGSDYGRLDVPPDANTYNTVNRNPPHAATTETTTGENAYNRLEGAHNYQVVQPGSDSGVDEEEYAFIG